MAPEIEKAWVALRSEAREDNNRLREFAAKAVNFPAVLGADTAQALFPLDSPAHRFQVVDTPVSYYCNTAAGTLTRHSGYAIQSVQPNPPAGGVVIAQDISDCTFTYDTINERYGLVSMRIVLSRNNETVSLYHEVHISNVP